MRCDHCRKVFCSHQLDEIVKNLTRGSGIKVAGRFISEQNVRFIGQSPGNGHPLLFTA